MEVSPISTVSWSSSSIPWMPECWTWKLKRRGQNTRWMNDNHEVITWQFNLDCPHKMISTFHPLSTSIKKSKYVVVSTIVQSFLEQLFQPQQLAQIQPHVVWSRERACAPTGKQTPFHRSSLRWPRATPPISFDGHRPLGPSLSFPSGKLGLVAAMCATCISSYVFKILFFYFGLFIYKYIVYFYIYVLS